MLYVTQCNNKLSATVFNNAINMKGQKEFGEHTANILTNNHKQTSYHQQKRVRKSTEKSRSVS